MTRLLIVFVVAAGGGVMHAQQPTLIDRVAWLQGCWEASSPQRTIEEHWMAPRGGSMLGMSRTVRGGRLAAQELVVLREDGEQLAYQAHPSGQPSAVFTSAVLSDSLVLFENPEHDFPQKVGYQPVGADSLMAWIEGPASGQTRRIEFRYRRSPCPGT